MENLKVKDIFVIKEIEHNGVKVTIKVDYDKMTLSLVERASGSWRDKKWNFSGRELNFMQGWQNILGAMSKAIGYGTILLEERREENLLESANIAKKVFGNEIK